ncbi:hypothetical protein EN836_29840 [Mesorhizobium sp. M1C.F.Ca.ET.193.01.1.1]|nr:hypothetical protein EJ074_18325 [Mesorhizobium sp. M3A.F.Ca.ET.080.04.2.1]RWA61592.1 MAG: hypothetical protein EOQ29_31375 [Mesorhizobium sp.]TGQ50242.1 hypothetical protein EN853_29830 [Mesorhizobium sp. M1C.F.Ca.ET.210.01.1.1]TGQ65177.1 hypothetical protein EN855_029845 [Mesorhizobium sp. M1C.F.Ca.ET.212.01.1.1]TGQ98716.1 hypothetical protein EN847_29830 [Mesorhizobium sp. M1C.F.Ca.ET.204.01.1.1]TGR19005.1 hypothetical protein EN839_29830 [Mesorhizobium sp. M1C.F.Ca.ET.196.01.1.1]TGR415
MAKAVAISKPSIGRTRALDAPIVLFDLIVQMLVPADADRLSNRRRARSLRISGDREHRFHRIVSTDFTGS